MADLKTVWVAMLTDDSEGAGTDSPIVLIVNVTGGSWLHREENAFLKACQKERNRRSRWRVSAFEGGGIPLKFA